MPVRRCQNCNYIIPDPSAPCSSCGTMYVDSSAPSPVAQPAAKSTPSGGGFSATEYSEFSIGTVLSRSFSAFLKHPFVFIGLCVLAQVPGVLLSFLTFGSPIGVILVPLVSFVLTFAAQGAIAYGVYEVLRGNAVRFGQSVSRGMSRAVPIIFASLVLYIAFVAIGFIGGLLVALLAAILGSLGVFIGSLLLAFVIIRQFCKWSVFIPVCAVERVGPIDSLSRSSVLTEFFRVQIFLLFLLNFGIVGLLFAAVGIVFGGMLFATIAGGAGILALIVLGLFFPLSIAIPMAFFSVMVSVIYYELRGVKDGIGVENLVNVFD